MNNVFRTFGDFQLAVGESTKTPMAVEGEEEGRRTLGSIFKVNSSMWLVKINSSQLKSKREVNKGEEGWAFKEIKNQLKW